VSRVLVAGALRGGRDPAPHQVLLHASRPCSQVRLRLQTWLDWQRYPDFCQRDDPDPLPAEAGLPPLEGGEPLLPEPTPAAPAPLELLPLLASGEPLEPVVSPEPDLPEPVSDSRTAGIRRLSSCVPDVVDPEFPLLLVLLLCFAELSVLVWPVLGAVVWPAARKHASATTDAMRIRVVTIVFMDCFLPCG